jgi:hypothetical protein
MAKSKTAIVNQALLMINEDEIQDFENATSQVERVAKRLFDDVYDEVCAEFPWNFCTKTTQLAETADDPIATWSNSFSIPNTPKTLRLISIENVGNADPNWERQGDLLLINQAECYVKLIFRQEDISQVPSHVVRCVATLLASRMAVPLLGIEASNLATYYQNLYTSDVRPSALYLDANEGKQKTVEESTVMGGNFVDGVFVPSGSDYNVYVDVAEVPNIY